jgi:hypothetical protein
MSVNVSYVQLWYEVDEFYQMKEYQTSNDFAADVEFVSSNTLTFIRDGTHIWQDPGNFIS